MKLVHILAPVSYGGGERILSDLVSAFSQKKVQQEFILLSRSSEFESQLLNLNIPMYSLTNKKLNASPSKLAYCFLLCRCIMRILFCYKNLSKKTEESIVIAHGFPANLISLPLRSKKKIYSNHAIKKQMFFLPKIFYLVALARFNRIVSVGECAHKSFLSVFPSLKKRCVQIDNGVSEIFFQNKIRKQPISNFPTACYVARFSPSKNHDFLVNVLKKITNLNLVLAGDGDTLQSIKNAFIEAGVLNRVTFTGSVPPNSVPNLLASIDFVVFPSKSEGYGLAIAEALVIGKPVVLFKEVASMAFCNAGCLVSQNETEFIDNVKKITQTPSLRSELELRNMLIRNQFSIDRCADRYIDVFSL